ncbi:hypothetical protein Tco_0421505 [Tanacetum coccineum]
MAGVDINTLTIEQYLALSRENQAPGMVKPEIGGNVNFEIRSQFMRELREDTFSGNKNEDAHDHIDRVLNIVIYSIFPEYQKMPYYYVCSHSLLLDLLKDGWIDSLQELSTLETSLKRSLSRGIVNHQKLLNSLKTSITSNKKAMNHYTKLGNVTNSRDDTYSSSDDNINYG